MASRDRTPGRCTVGQNHCFELSDGGGGGAVANRTSK
jgi:hypothetical protein